MSCLVFSNEGAEESAQNPKTPKPHEFFSLNLSNLQKNLELSKEMGAACQGTKVAD